MLFWILLFVLGICFYMRYRKRDKDVLIDAHFLHNSDNPKAKSALDKYEQAARNGFIQAYLPIAQIYEYGFPDGSQPIPPNPTAAQDAYLQLALYGDAREQAVAKERLYQLGTIHTDLGHIEIDTVREPLPNTIRRVEDLEPINAQTGEVRILSDSQNVHDSSIVKSLRKSLDNLGKPLSEIGSSLANLRSYINENVTNDQDKFDALSTIDKMEANTIPVTALEMTEASVLHRVWSAINDNLTLSEADVKLRRDMLIQRLAEGFEEGTCTSGRVARVVDALSTFDDRVILKPEWAIRQEMLTKAALVRDTVAPEKLKESLTQTFRQDYVDTGLMSNEKLLAELESWGEL